MWITRILVKALSYFILFIIIVIFCSKVASSYQLLSYHTGKWEEKDKKEKQKIQNLTNFFIRIPHWLYIAIKTRII